MGTILGGYPSSPAFGNGSGTSSYDPLVLSHPASKTMIWNFGE
jgi:hypothetical protein